jgi:hypothetical protein
MERNEFFSVSLIDNGSIEHWRRANVTGNDKAQVRVEHIFMPMGPKIKEFVLNDLKDELDPEKEEFLVSVDHLFAVLVQNSAYWFIAGYPCTADGKTFDIEPFWGGQGSIAHGLDIMEKGWKDIRDYFEGDLGRVE